MYERFADFCDLIRDLTEEESPWLLLPVGFLVIVGVMLLYGANALEWVIVLGGIGGVLGLLGVAELASRIGND